MNKILAKIRSMLCLLRCLDLFVTIKQSDPSNKWIVQQWLSALLLKILLCSATRFWLTAMLLVLSGPFPHWPGLVLWQQLQMNYLSCFLASVDSVSSWEKTVGLADWNYITDRVSVANIACHLPLNLWTSWFFFNGVIVKNFTVYNYN